MPLFTLNKIAAAAENRQVYLRGISCYNSGKVRHVRRGIAPPNNREYIAASVESSKSDKEYTVTVTFHRDGSLYKFACSCPCNDRFSGCCKHVTAVLAYKYYNDMLGGFPEQTELRHRTDRAAKRLLEECITRRTVGLQVETGNRQPVSLYPRLEITKNGIFASFTVGRERGYIIKDLRRFVRDMQQGATVRYGSGLTLLHHPDMFTAESRPMLAFVMSAARPDADFRFGYGGGQGRGGRELPLPARLLEGFLEAAGGHPIPCTGQINGTLTTADGVPSIALQAQWDAGAGGLRLAMEPLPVLRGVGRIYLPQDGRLLRCDKRFSADMEPFLSVMQEMKGKLFFAREDIPAFCAGLLPMLIKNTEMSGDLDALAPYRPVKAEGQLYLDAGEDGEGRRVIRGELAVRYGEEVYYPCRKDARVQGMPENRDIMEETRLRLLCERWFGAFDAESGTWLFSGGDEEWFNFLTDGLEAMGADCTLYIGEDLREAGVRSPPAVSVGVGLSVDLLELEVDGGDISREEWMAVLQSYRSKKRYHRLKNGQFLRLAEGSAAAFARLLDGLNISERQLRSGVLTVPKYRAFLLDDMAGRGDIRVGHSTLVKDIVAGYTRDTQTSVRPPASLEPVLRGYQKTGFGWLMTLKAYGFGGILADDMGLGKTLQIITFLLHARESGVVMPSLVVCPTSLVCNWQQEIARFAPSLTVIPIVGTAQEREIAIGRIGGYDVAVTSYELLRRDQAAGGHYNRHTFFCHVLDEAQYIKNQSTQNARAAKSIASRHRFALTGTPIENRLSELWSIFDFLMPGFLYSYAHFRERFELPLVKNNDSEVLDRLTRMCRPFILRRLKTEVLTELPPKVESVLLTVFDGEQDRIYKANVAAARDSMTENMRTGAAGQFKLHVLALLTRLRQLCCHPALCYEDYAGTSAKLESCMELLREAVAGGHRVLVFSQFTAMLEILERRLTEEGFAYYLLRGSTPRERRAEMTESFNRPECAVSVFLISLKAGGTGLNLTGADTVIHFDPWWNLSAQNQATDRTHRIGQQNSVQVYKLIAKGTVEEKILQLQQIKMTLADAVIREGDGMITTMTPQELMAIFE